MEGVGPKTIEHFQNNKTNRSKLIRGQWLRPISGARLYCAVSGEKESGTQVDGVSTRPGIGLANAIGRDFELPFFR